ncbi:hypothetical protein F0562_025449 [Nyssa sinensis]|uniref:DUF4283 domain-containing protein n=1 Tax=Nyssa sinensis TaxID=561372 RepID=A0A5J5BFV0_9ASTE|nr:hypothetical protein F0562_025449 [Nyssa sinensis]
MEKGKQKRELHEGGRKVEEGSSSDLLTRRPFQRRMVDDSSNIQVLGVSKPEKIKNSRSSFLEVARVGSWPSDPVMAEVNPGGVREDVLVHVGSCDSRLKFLKRCVLGKFGDLNSPVPEKLRVQRWAQNHWGIQVRLNVLDLNGTWFLFELPSEVEVYRILRKKDWSFEGRRKGRHNFGGLNARWGHHQWPMRNGPFLRGEGSKLRAQAQQLKTYEGAFKGLAEPSAERRKTIEENGVDKGGSGKGRREREEKNQSAMARSPA